MPLLVPAVNAADEKTFVARARLVRAFGCPWVQVDVADGLFGTPGNFATPAASERELQGLNVDVHLMVQAALESVYAWSAASPARLTIHAEVTSDPAPVLAAIRDQGVERGLALSPDTPVERVEPLLAEVDFLLFVAVPPGRSGQPFDPNTLERVRSVRWKWPDLNIGVDGGVNANLIPELLAAGATTLCCSSAIFDSLDPAAAYEELRALVERL